MTRNDKERVKDLAAMIAQLKSPAERKRALHQQVPHYLRHEVEILLAQYDEIRRKSERRTKTHEK